MTQLVSRHTFTLHCPDEYVRGMTAWSSKVEQLPGSVKSPPFPQHQPARGPTVVSTESLWSLISTSQHTDSSSAGEREAAQRLEVSSGRAAPHNMDCLRGNKCLQGLDVPAGYLLAA